jgi:type II secretory pathway component GspD/PulD (secretin)
MVMGPPESITKVQTILEQLEQRPKQVYLAVVIGRLSVGENLDYAVDVFQKFYPNAAKGKSYGYAGGSRNRLGNKNLVGGVAAPNTLTEVTDFLADGVATGAGLTIYGSISKSIDAFLEALESTDRFEIISRPAIYTANNRTASIINGERIAVPASTIQSDTGSNFRTNIEYEEIVLQIEVTPLINSENEITLQVYQLNETKSGTTVIDGNPIPDIATQELSTEITVANRSTVLLGGLITTDVQDSSSGWPLLHRIPILGGLFGSKSNSGSRTELVILIQPIVLDTDADTMHNTVVEMDQTQMGYKWLEANGITNATRGVSSLIESRDTELEQANRQRLSQQPTQQPDQEPALLPSQYPEALPPLEPQPAQPATNKTPLKKKPRR